MSAAKRYVNERSGPLDSPLPVDSQFLVNSRRSTIFERPQHKGMLRS